MKSGSRGRRLRVRASPDKCKYMQDEVSATCQCGAARHPRGYTGHAMAVSHTFRTTIVALAINGGWAAACQQDRESRQDGRSIGICVCVLLVVAAQAD